MKILPPGGKDGSRGTRLACSDLTSLDGMYSRFPSWSPSIDAARGMSCSQLPHESLSSAVQLDWDGTKCMALVVLSLAPSDDKSRREAKPLVHPQDADDRLRTRVITRGRASGTDCTRAARAFPSMAMGV
jgi:hypothetical protein